MQKVYLGNTSANADVRGARSFAQYGSALNTRTRSNDFSISNSMVSSAIWGINSMSEWLLIAPGEAECNYAIHECY